MNEQLSVLNLGIVALVAGIGAYFGLYLKTKGKNLATHEDIGMVVEQVRAVTEATELIRGNMWSRQKWLETRKEILLEAVRNAARAQSLLAVMIVSIEQIDSAGTDDDRSTALSRFNECADQVKEMAKTLSEALTFVRLVSGTAVVTDFDKVYSTFCDAGKFLTTESIGAATNNMNEFGNAVEGLHSSIRAELKESF